MKVFGIIIAVGKNHHHSLFVSPRRQWANWMIGHVQAGLNPARIHENMLGYRVQSDRYVCIVHAANVACFVAAHL